MARNKAPTPNKLNLQQPEKITHDSFGRLSRPRPFSQVGFSKVAPGLLLVMIDFALDALTEVRKCAGIMSATGHHARKQRH
jgi:hypothetical protein